MLIKNVLYFRDYQSNLEFKPLRDSELVEDHQITVCVRKRPLNKKGITSLFSYYCCSHK